MPLWKPDPTFYPSARMAGPNFFIDFEEGERPHQIHLEGGDASSDSYCYP